MPTLAVDDRHIVYSHTVQTLTILLINVQAQIPGMQNSQQEVNRNVMIVINVFER